MKKFKGVIIEESLENKEILEEVKILSTRIEKVTEEHQTPWLSQWTLHTVEIEPEKVAEISQKLSESLEHDWYADFNNGETFYVIFRNKIFTYKKGDKIGRQKVIDYGLSLGIPKYQLDFP